MIARLLTARDAQMESLLLLFLRLIFGLWTRPGVVDDPLLVAATTAATAYHMDVTLARTRAVENAYVQAVSREMGVEFSAEERQTNPLVPRNADPIDVASRYIEEYRWQMFGKPAQEAARAAERDEDGPPIPEFVVDAPSAPQEAPAAPVEEPDDRPLALLDLEDDEEAEERRKDEAHRRAYDRQQAIMQASMQRAAGDEFNQLIGKKRVFIGYRRVIRPELSRTGTCGLCIVAASRVYKKKDLAPIHQNCRCGQVPQTKELDPGETLNREDIEDVLTQGADDSQDPREVRFTREELNELYDAAGGTTAGAALKKVRVQYVDHGELGPTVRYDVERPTKTTPYKEPSWETTRGHWESTRTWAEAKKALMQAAIQRGETGPASYPYAQAMRQFDSLIARMEENLRQRERA